jgi:carboxymethylenebutenolidase
MPVPVLCHYRPKPGAEAALEALVARHTPTLQALGLASPRAPWVMRAADGAIVELFAWANPEAAGAAHQHPAVQALWGQFAEVCTFEPLAALPEAARPFAHLANLERPDPFAAEGCAEVWLAAAGGQRVVRAALATPAGAGPWPAVIVLHEWWGLNADMRRTARRLADEGYLALALDLYDAEPTEDAGLAWERSNAMTTAASLESVRGALDFLRARPDCTGRVGVTGFCLGGGQSLAAAAQVDGLAAAAPFYGLCRPDFATWERVTCPIEGHYAIRDGAVGPDRVEPVFAAMRQAGVEATLHWYAAGHAFMRAGDPKAYDAASAALAWERLLAFFARCLR